MGESSEPRLDFIQDFTLKSKKSILLIGTSDSVIFTRDKTHEIVILKHIHYIVMLDSW